MLYASPNSGQVTLENAFLKCCFSPLGASIVSVYSKEATQFIAMSPVSFSTFAPDPSLAGRTVGPLCGRVRGGQAASGDGPLMLERNEGENHLHGGSVSCSSLLWSCETVSKDHVCFKLMLPDGLCGYPGERVLQAEYRLDGPMLTVLYRARSSRATPLCLTNHVYWDLGGRFDGSAMGQMLTLSAEKVVRNDSAHLPEKILPAAGTPLDLASPGIPGQIIKEHPEEAQFSIARGFNNCYLLSPNLVEKNGFAAKLHSPLSGITMTMRTDAPAVVFYSGGFLGADTMLQAGPAVPGCALALEAQDVPDPWHLPGIEARILSANIPWTRTISWCFALDKA